MFVTFTEHSQFRRRFGSFQLIRSLLEIPSLRSFRSFYSFFNDCHPEFALIYRKLSVLGEIRGLIYQIHH
ncbi:hypothetical protein SAMN06264867_1127 [Halorubrum cibi]|uniref:Uncharacterized protein n=1 Tax=Halorubrum cibi TaxID=413815 RepID=A0A521EPV2_9EURY|nr:hypothetical protein SAMN06264867_1127 [Halorubrum cibi]